MKTVLLADDHEIIRLGIQMIIERNFGAHNFVDASTCKEVNQILSKDHIDYIVLDLFLADGNTFPLVDHILGQYPGVSILVYTSSPETIYGKRLIQKGVRGFVCKQAGIAEVEQAICIFFNGGIYLSSELKEILAETNKKRAVDTLSDRELEVVEYLTMGMPIKEISYKMKVDSTTVSHYRKRILSKLGVENNIDLKEEFSLYKMLGKHNK